jgi:choice-of-anchor A domain-containing protein
VRKSLLLAASSAVVAAGIFVAVAVMAAPLPGGLGPCAGAACPNPFPPVSNDPFAGYDDGISVLVGGDYLVRDAGAEAEGHVVVVGDFDLSKNPPGGFNVGIAGVGSRVPPPPGSDFLSVGGNVNIAASNTLLADGGVVRYAGSVTGTGTISGTAIMDANAVAPYTNVPPQLTTASQCYSTTTTATGTISDNGFGSFTFTGDGTSALQVFNLTTDLATASGGGSVVAFSGIPAGATILVNVTKPGTWTARVDNGDIADADPWNQLRSHLLWNVSAATTVNLIGTGQFQGSMLVASPASTTLYRQSGMAGRFFTAGNLTHAGGGSEFHNYPFDGNLPDCTAVSPNGSPTTEPLGTPAATDSPAPAESPAASTASSSGGGLPLTGGRLLPVMGFGFGLVLLGGVLLIGAMRFYRDNA